VAILKSKQHLTLILVPVKLYNEWETNEVRKSNYVVIFDLIYGTVT